MAVETITNFTGRILGEVETLPNGDKVARDFYGKITGFYYASDNRTTDFSGNIIGWGDFVVSTILQENGN